MADHIRGLFVELVIISLLVQASSAAPAAAAATNTFIAGFRAQLTHRDAFMELSYHEQRLERLTRAATASKLRAEAIATRSSSAPSAPIFSDDKGVYFVTLALGTPPQTFSAILDTASDLVWLQSDPCFQCYNQTGHVFHPSSSSTYKNASCADRLCVALPTSFCYNSKLCEYSHGYGVRGENTVTTGFLAYDTLTIGKYSLPNFAFGAGFLNYGPIDALSAAGIAGMRAGPLSLPSQLAHSNSIENNSSKFSYCLVTWTDAPSKTSPLLFGSHAKFIDGTGVQSTPFLSNPAHPSLYYLTMQGISVGGTPLDIPSGTFDIHPNGLGGFIIDSGSTVTLLVDAAYTPLLNAYSSAIPFPTINGSALGLDLCYNTSNSPNATSIPALAFLFDGADLSLPPQNIFFDYKEYFCLAFAKSPVNISILGNMQQQNIQFLYDKGSSSNQLSFKPVMTCDTLLQS